MVNRSEYEIGEQISNSCSLYSLKLKYPWDWYESISSPLAMGKITGLILINSYCFSNLLQAKKISLGFT